MNIGANRIPEFYSGSVGERYFCRMCHHGDGTHFGRCPVPVVEERMEKLKAENEKLSKRSAQ